MQTWNNDIQACPKPEIIASRLTSIRNIYLRQEVCTISNQIQEQYKERLPALHLVSIAAYEQVFNRQPLSLPGELRREAVKYGLKYYQFNLEKLRIAEAQNGLCPNHDRLSCFDDKCPLHQSNTTTSSHNLSEATQIDENQSDSQYSVSSTRTKSEHQSSGSSLTSITSNNPGDSTTTTDTNSTATSVLSEKSSAISTTTSTFSDTNITSSSTDISSETGLNSSSTDSFSESASNRSMISAKTTQSSASIMKRSRRKPPKIIIRRASDNSLTSKDTKNSLITIAGSQTSARKKSMRVHRSSSNKRRRRKKSKNKNAIKSRLSSLKTDTSIEKYP